MRSHAYDGFAQNLQAPHNVYMAFERLDFIYTPSPDVVADTAYFEDILEGEVVFAIESGDARVAMIDLTGVL